MYIARIMSLIGVVFLLTGLLAAEVSDSTGVTQTAAASEVIQDQTDKPPSQEGEEFTSVSGMLAPSLLRIAGSLVVIIVFIYGAVFLLRKLSGNRVGGAGRDKTVRLIEQTYLAPKKSVCLIKMADRAVLVGVTEAQISMLTEMEWDSLPQKAQQMATAQQGGFQNLLGEAATRLFKGKNKGDRREQAI